MWGSLRGKLEDGTAVVGVLGLGYVGLPLAVAFSKRYRVIGFDVRPELVQAVRRGEPNGHSVTDRELRAALDTRFVPTTDFCRLDECDVVIICVGTPLTHSRHPDLSQVECASREIAKRLRPGQLVVLESTSYPGTTEEVVVPILEKMGLRAGVDFGVAYSPERIDPGNANYRVEQIPKLVGGLDDETTEVACDVYSRIIETVVPVGHARIAEAAKMIENVFRAVNIALINEVALILERLGIDTWEAIRAASTKPFGFTPFYPGPGIGGHCIPLDPFYLAYRARKAGHMPRFIELSGEINEYMKFHTLNMLRSGLGEAGKRAWDSTVAILGLSFKRNISDTRESPAVRIIEECIGEGMTIHAYDPLARSVSTGKGVVLSAPDVESALEGADAAVILVDHDEFLALDYDTLTTLMVEPAVWVDTRGVLPRPPKGSIALGIGRPFGRLGSENGLRSRLLNVGTVGVSTGDRKSESGEMATSESRLSSPSGLNKIRGP